jgi:DNA-directed RNA polymerase subunit RPC12/RpoP
VKKIKFPVGVAWIAFSLLSAVACVDCTLEFSTILLSAGVVLLAIWFDERLEGMGVNFVKCPKCGDNEAYISEDGKWIECPNCGRKTRIKKKAGQW